MRHVLLDKRDQRLKARLRVAAAGKLNDDSQGYFSSRLKRCLADIVGGEPSRVKALPLSGLSDRGFAGQ
jgi:hypothetical protein